MNAAADSTPIRERHAIALAQVYHGAENRLVINTLPAATEHGRPAALAIAPHFLAEHRAIRPSGTVHRKIQYHWIESVPLEGRILWLDRGERKDGPTIAKRFLVEDQTKANEFVRQLDELDRPARTNTIDREIAAKEAELRKPGERKATMGTTP